VAISFWDELLLGDECLNIFHHLNGICLYSICLFKTVNVWCGEFTGNIFLVHVFMWPAVHIPKMSSRCMTSFVISTPFDQAEPKVKHLMQVSESY
jgi:hypothetical protein